jgi:hypothetical protein
VRSRAHRDLRAGAGTFDFPPSPDTARSCTIAHDMRAKAHDAGTISHDSRTITRDFTPKSHDSPYEFQTNW